MKISRILIVSILLITAFMAQTVVCGAYGAEEFNIKNINVYLSLFIIYLLTFSIVLQILENCSQAVFLTLNISLP